MTVKGLVRHRVIAASWFMLFPSLYFCDSPFCLVKMQSQNPSLVDLSQHPKSFGVSDGLQESFFQLLLGGVFWEQQCIKAGVRGW